MNLQITSSKLECNVNNYTLTLISNNSKNHRTQEPEIRIVSTSENSHFIGDLPPGYQYKVILTPNTINGPLKSSGPYEFTTLTKSKYFQYVYTYVCKLVPKITQCTRHYLKSLKQILL